MSYCVKCRNVLFNITQFDSLILNECYLISKCCQLFAIATKVGSSKAPPERPPPPSSVGKPAKSVASSSASAATVVSQDDATNKGLKKSIPHEDCQHQRQAILITFVHLKIYL